MAVNFEATNYFCEKLGKQGFGNFGVTQRIIAAMALTDIMVRITNLVVIASIDITAVMTSILQWLSCFAMVFMAIRTIDVYVTGSESKGKRWVAMDLVTLALHITSARSCESKDLVTFGLHKEWQ